MKKYSQGGFTLIELLVVIAIIGILSSVVLASLSTARSRGRDAAIRSGLSSLRTQIELDNSTGTFGAFAGYSVTQGTNAACGIGIFNSNAVIPIKNNIVANLTNATDIVCSTDVASATAPATRWAVTAIMSGTTGAICTDSTGNTKTYSAATTVATLTASMVNAGACI